MGDMGLEVSARLVAIQWNRTLLKQPAPRARIRASSSRGAISWAQRLWVRRRRQSRQSRLQPECDPATSPITPQPATRRQTRKSSPRALWSRPDRQRRRGRACVAAPSPHANRSHSLVMASSGFYAPLDARCAFDTIRHHAVTALPGDRNRAIRTACGDHPPPSAPP